MNRWLAYLFAPAAPQGVRRVHLYLLRLVYLLMFVMLGQTTWTHVLTQTSAWEPYDAMVWSVWTAFATLAGLGLLQPLKMLPILLLEIFYKVMWLVLVAYPLWRSGQLADSRAVGMTAVFLPVALPIVAIPWRYVVATYCRYSAV